MWGEYPSKDAIRAYDVTLDLILRLGYDNAIYQPVLGPTDYIENRFDYQPLSNQSGYENVGYYLLQHQDYRIVEIKK